MQTFNYVTFLLRFKILFLVIFLVIFLQILLSIILMFDWFCGLHWCVRVIWFPVLMFFLIHLLCLLGLEINWATLKCCWIYETSIAFFFINEILIFLEMRMRGRVTHDYGLLKVFFFLGGSGVWDTSILWAFTSCFLRRIVHSEVLGLQLSSNVFI